MIGLGLDSCSPSRLATAMRSSCSLKEACCSSSDLLLRSDAMFNASGWKPPVREMDTDAVKLNYKGSESKGISRGAGDEKVVIYSSLLLHNLNFPSHTAAAPSGRHDVKPGRAHHGRGAVAPAKPLIR